MKELLYCKECGGMIDFSVGVTLLCSPPKYQYACSACHSLRQYSVEEFEKVKEDIDYGSGT